MDFMRNIRGGGYYDATYGIDCSGFVCNAWNVSNDCNTQTFYDAIRLSNSSRFEKVGSYSAGGTYSVGNVSKQELKTAYESLKAGDAIVTRRANETGHARLVMSVDLTNKTVTTVEASGNFPNYATYTFDQLADDYYCPFTVKSSYYNSLN